MTNPTQIALLAIGLFILWKLFFARTSFLAYLVYHTNFQLLSFVLAILRFCIYGYATYILIAVFGNIGRVSTPEDVLTIIQARPSALGGPGLIGVLLGIVIGISAFSAIYSGSAGQGRTVTVEPIKTTPRPIVWFMVRMYRWIKR